MEEIQVKEPFIIKSIVNGLIATSIIWTFWTPFLIFLAGPLTSAIIKNALCFVSFGLDYYVDAILGYNAYQGFEVYQRSLPNPPTVAQKIIDNDSTDITLENTNIYVVFGITAVFVVSVSLYIASYLIRAYNLNVSEIVTFNIVMAIIIVAIEISFFAGVATQYSPFDIKIIASKLSDKILSTLQPLAQ
jgi:hypothetical protein